VKGVGTQIALTYVLTLDDPHRFPKSREVGCFLGLRPGRSDSGESQPQMHISKEGDPYLRTITATKRCAPRPRVKSSPQKRGCYGSTELAIVVARRSWFETSLWKTGKGRKEKKGAQKEEGEKTEMVSKQPSSTAEIR